MGSDDRNRELDEAVSDPYIEKPDELDVGDGQMCWLDSNRMCGPDCKAFNLSAEQGPEQCLFLVRSGKATDAVIGIEQLIRQMLESNSVPKV